MKKSFIISFAMMLLMAFTLSFALTSCSEDIQTEENTEKETETEVKQVVFSSYDDATRTSIDTDRKFYWETGDNIWVNNGGTYIQSTSSDITEKTYKANFTFNAALTNPDGYEVFYTGQNSPEAASATADALHVTIAANQTQSAWNDATHLGTSGDCGTAMAEKNGNDYRFKLEHKAAYLIIYPYISNTYARTYSLTKLEITSDNTIAGTYPFSMSGLDTDNVTNASNTITLTPSTPLEMGKEVGNHLFVVIQPGTHSLSLKYTYKNEADEEFTTTKTLTADRTFSVNGVTVIKHKIIPFAFKFEDTFFMWDAEQWCWYGKTIYPTTNNQVGTVGYATSSDADRWYNNTTETKEGTEAIATRSAAGMPCYNAMSWYLTEGAYWDNIEWTITDSDRNIYTRAYGIWLKKWDYVTRKPTGSTLANCSTRSGITRIIPTAGKPVLTEIDQWFFLPMLGAYDGGQILVHQGINEDATGYWLSTPQHDEAGLAYYLRFWSGYVDMHYARHRYKNNGFVAGTRPDGTPWFQ